MSHLQHKSFVVRKFYLLKRESSSIKIPSLYDSGEYGTIVMCPPLDNSAITGVLKLAANLDPISILVNIF